MLDPSIWEDADVGSLPYPARLLFIGLISYADDESRGDADPRFLRKAIFGFDSEVTFESVSEWLALIASKVRGLVLYEKEEKKYYALLNWHDYQKISHPSPSRIPAPNGMSQKVSSQEKNETGEVFKEWEKVWGMINGTAADELSGLIDEWDAHLKKLPEKHVNRRYAGAQAVRLAIQEGVRAVNRPNLKYVAAIVKNWMQNGYGAGPSNKKPASKPHNEGMTKEEVAKAKRKR